MPRFLREVTAYKDDTVLMLEAKCPGCGGTHYFRIRQTPGDNPDKPHPQWGFDGNYEKPTFTPSMLVTGLWAERGKEIKQICHSFLENGEWRFLADCTHSMAGRKHVPMIPFDIREPLPTPYQETTMDAQAPEHFKDDPNRIYPYDVGVRVMDLPSEEVMRIVDAASGESISQFDKDAAQFFNDASNEGFKAYDPSATDKWMQSPALREAQRRAFEALVARLHVPDFDEVDEVEQNRPSREELKKFWAEAAAAPPPTADQASGDGEIVDPIWAGVKAITDLPKRVPAPTADERFLAAAKHRMILPNMPKEAAMYTVYHDSTHASRKSLADALIALVEPFEHEIVDLDNIEAYEVMLASQRHRRACPAGSLRRDRREPLVGTRRARRAPAHRDLYGRHAAVHRRRDADSLEREPVQGRSHDL